VGANRLPLPTYWHRGSSMRWIRLISDDVIQRQPVGMWWRASNLAWAACSLRSGRSRQMIVFAANAERTGGRGPWHGCCRHELPMPDGGRKRMTFASRCAAAVLLMATSFIGPAAQSAFAQNDAARRVTTSTSDAAGQGTTEAGRGPSQKAVEIARPFGFPITNSMAVSWIVAAGLIAFARVATRDMKRVPEGAQNLLEWLVGRLYDFLPGIICPRPGKATVLVFAAILFFILSPHPLRP